MTERDRRRPLWASGLAEDDRRERDDVIVRVLEVEPEEELEQPSPAPSPPAEPQGSPRALLAGLAAAACLFAAAGVLEARATLTFATVPSGWADVPMTCRTARLEEGARAAEWFRCRALGGMRLPSGRFRSPGSRWTSDITRRDARENDIEISRDGEVVGEALYGPRRGG